MSEMESAPSEAPEGPEGEAPELSDAGGELSFEEQATAVGWNEDGELSAQEFIEKRDNHLGLSRADNQKLTREVARLNRQQEEMAGLFRANQQRAREEGYQKAFSEIQAAQSEAVSDADGERFAALEAQKAQLQQEYQTAPQSDLKAQMMQQANEIKDLYPEVFETSQYSQDWAKELKFQIDMHKRAPRDAMVKAVEIVAKKYNLNTSHPGLERSGESKGAGGDRSFATLPAKAKQSYENFKKLMPDYTKAEYAADYFAQEDS